MMEELLKPKTYQKATHRTIEVSILEMGSDNHVTTALCQQMCGAAKRHFGQ